MSTLLEKVCSRGYWRVVIRPNRFVSERISGVTLLFPLLDRTAVHLRSWGYPHLNCHKPQQIDHDWVGQQTEWEQYLEIWRFYQSGQFIHFSGMPEDWRDQSRLTPPDPDWRAGDRLDFENALLKCTEIFEFAARLAYTEAGDETMHIAINVNGLTDRRLFTQNRQLLLPTEYRATIQEWAFTLNIRRAELMAKPTELALSAAADLFGHFHWNAPPILLNDVQRSFRCR